MWRLWHQRALFDIHHNLKDPNHKPPRQVTVTCNFCPNSILTNVQSTVSRVKRYAQYSNPSNRTKVFIEQMVLPNDYFNTLEKVMFSQILVMFGRC
ncbi:PREDICTED: WD repeat-containing protein mio-like [Acropora digitifera]|uniref:WD repeat-containing protein mio-like n=1 Tax=Acropora digitifera TaxID=70779 RepID=UPI00077A4BA3|nr:PREDICTED: WD repeat-containing protein mio-like [Acropora digitifera]